MSLDEMICLFYHVTFLSQSLLTKCGDFSWIYKVCSLWWR